jgi:eukaryotic-like serine/threonine-protein kinase
VNGRGPRPQVRSVVVPGFDPTTPITIGRTLGGRYRLVAPIARGGMAEVWEGYDAVLSRPVAVKVLHSYLASDEVFLERFRREAITAARLAHPAVVATYDTGYDGGTAYIVMELVRGRTLRQMLGDQGRLEPWQAVAVARQIADALAAAHQSGLVHRDIKPANILLVEDGLGGLRVKVTDFGIAKAGADSVRDLTRTGTVLGTPKYLSPEQIRGTDPDARADLYSLGVVLYEMLVGEAPFAGDTDVATAMSHLNDRVPKVSARVRSVPPGLDKLVSDLLAKNPDRRIPSAVVLRQRLDALGPLAPPSVYPRGPTGRSSRRRATGYPPPPLPVVPAMDPGPTSVLPQGGPGPARASATGSLDGYAPPTGLIPAAFPPPSGAASGADKTLALSGDSPGLPNAPPNGSAPTSLGGAGSQAPGGGGWPAIAAGAASGPASPPAGRADAFPAGHAAPPAGYAAPPAAPAGYVGSSDEPGAPTARLQGPAPASPVPPPPGSVAASGSAAYNHGSDRSGAGPSFGSPTLSTGQGVAPPPARPSGSRTDPYGRYPTRSGFRRKRRLVGASVAALVVAGALVAVFVLKSDRHRAKVNTSATTIPHAVAAHISSVSVFMVDGRQPDNPDMTKYTYDGNPATYWETDRYHNSTFSNLYPGVGLAIDLSSAESLHSLAVTSASEGWAAQAFVSSTPVASGQPVTAWGQPTDTKNGINGGTTLSLSGRHGRYLLLWITNLGPADQVQVAELRVS